MKLIVVFSLLVVAVLAKPQAEILSNTYEQGETNYKFAYQLSDQQTREEEGELKQIPNDEPGIAVRGSYSFVADDGQTYTVTYIADENGFQPQGAHIPVAPSARK